ncbi:MAG: thiamine pyrophosphate-dependent dehydrogenase E1 component subunit alpha [Vulcanimicrobiaceae bacterium]
MMVLMRRFEEIVDRLYGSGKLYGTIHLYIGQEAVGAGVCGELTAGDVITSTHRGHGHNIAMGSDPNAMMAELLGRATGCCGGFGGSMHIADQRLGNLGANGIVGGGVPLAVGAALSFALREQPYVAVSFMGDGAPNEGCVHEAINIAAIWKLPVIFVIENNQYGLSASVKDTYAIERLSTRALAYGIPGETLDGQDVTAVAEAAAVAIARARTGGGPTLLEMLTYRFRGHSKNDPGKYRPRSELDEWRARDPIELARQRLLAVGVTEIELANVQADVEAVLADAVAFAEKSPFPQAADVLSAVYASAEGVVR